MPKKVLLFSALLMSALVLSACTPETVESPEPAMEETVPAGEAMMDDSQPADAEMIRDLTTEGEPDDVVKEGVMMEEEY